MAAKTFQTMAGGMSPEAAFLAARDGARQWVGEAGHSGTIAEKTEYRLAIGRPAELSAPAYAEQLAALPPAPGILVRCSADDAWTLEQEGSFYRTLPATPTTPLAHDLAVFHSETGPALCIASGPGEWLFCGTAAA
jgi:hypothetical protein